MTASELAALLRDRPVVAAVREESALLRALQSRAAAVFLLGGSIVTIPEIARLAREAGKCVFAHIDLMQGLKADSAAAEWCLRTGCVDGVISTRAQALKTAKELGLITIQRLFLVDSSSLKGGVRLLRANPPDMVEVLPGLVPKAIHTIREGVGRPVIAGGMITEAVEAERALAAGAIAVSTSEEGIWG